MALQIETALSADCSRMQRETLKAEIHTVLTYLWEIEDTWLNAKWASRVFDCVVKRTGLSLSESYPEGVGAPNEATINGARNNQGLNGEQQSEAVSYPLDYLEAFPDNWLQDIIDQGALNAQDHAMLEIFGAPSIF